MYAYTCILQVNTPALHAFHRMYGPYMMNPVWPLE